MFENKLAEALTVDHWLLTEKNIRPTTNDQRPTCIYIEDESQRIGNLQIPKPLWQTMRNSRVYFLDIPFEERLDFLTQEYKSFSKEKLVNAIIRIQKRLGGLETKNAINFLLEDNHKECFRILLKYYDKWYLKGLHNREDLPGLLYNIVCENIDVTINAQKIIDILSEKK